MKTWKTLPALFAICIAACKNPDKKVPQEGVNATDTVATKVQDIVLPEPFATPSVKNYSKTEGWPAGKMPAASSGLKISLFADGLKNPRWLYVATNGDVFVAEANSAHNTLEKITGKNKSEDRISLLRDKNADGIAEERYDFITGLNKPFGMAILNNKFYVANTDAVLTYPYQAGINEEKAKPDKILDLPGGPRHWTRNIIANPDKSKLYVAVGSSTDHGENGPEKETRRANILEINPDGSGERIFAWGLRNPVGMDWFPGTSDLWTVVNERDELGDGLVPDYLAQVKQNSFYGWPWAYYGKHPDPRVKDYKQAVPTVAAVIPDLALGSHTASLGLKFYTGNNLPEKYKNGAFIGQHGSWNKSSLAGFKVVFVPFKNGRPTGPAEDVVTGFIEDAPASQVYGRPVCIAMAADGAILIADDAGGKIWRLSKQ